MPLLRGDTGWMDGTGYPKNKNQGFVLAEKRILIKDSLRFGLWGWWVGGTNAPIFRGYLSIYYVWIWRLARTDPAHKNFSRKKFDNLYKSLYIVRTMKRVNYHLTTKQIEALKQASESTGLSVAELIRRALDSWMQKDKNHGD